jgi:hypothetical protein
MAGITAPSTNIISAIVFQFIFFIIVLHRYFKPKILRCYGVLPASEKSLRPHVQFGSDVCGQARAKSMKPRWTSVLISLTRT